MVVTYKYDADFVDQFPGDGIIIPLGNWKIGWLEHQAFATGKIKGELSRAVTLQGVGVSGQQVGYVGHGQEVGQPGSEFSGAVVTQLSAHDLLLFAERLEVSGGEFYIHEDSLL
jgi:hypothetical protein